MSLYTGKARSYLRKKGVRFEMRSTSHPGYARVAERVGRNYQPILETAAGDFVQDTTEIIDFVEAQHPEPAVYPTGPRQRLVALLLELYGDEGLLKPAMHYRWNFPEANDAFLASEFGRGISATEIPLSPEALRSFSGSKEQARWEIVSSVMRSRALPTYGVNAESIAAIEVSYADLLGRLEAHLQASPYFLGGRPSVGDFGMLAPLYAHLGRDPEPRSLMQSRAPMVYRWVERMNASDADAAEFPEEVPAFLPNDEVPETLLEILRLVAEDFLPELLGIFASVESWLAARPESRPDERVPQPSATAGAEAGIGSHRVSLRGVSIELGVRHYAVWMAQRPRDLYAGFVGADRRAVDALLDATGLRPLFDLAPGFRVERRGCCEHVVVASPV